MGRSDAPVDLEVIDLDDDRTTRAARPPAPGPTAARRPGPDDPWWARTGARAWFALAAVGVVVLVAATARPERPAATPRPVPAPPATLAYSPLVQSTGAHLALYHVGRWSELDVDRATVRPIGPASLPPELADIDRRRDALGRLPPRSPASPYLATGPTVCLGWREPTRARIAADGTCREDERSSNELAERATWAAGGRFLFLLEGADLLVVDTIEEGFVRRVDVTLPPCEAVLALDPTQA